jgi:hypothetical protein
MASFPRRIRFNSFLPKNVHRRARRERRENREGKRNNGILEYWNSEVVEWWVLHAHYSILSTFHFPGCGCAAFFSSALSAYSAVKGFYNKKAVDPTQAAHGSYILYI